MKQVCISIILLLCAGFCKGQWKPYNFTGKTDTIERIYVEVDSFLIQYIHSGSYMETAVGRVICDIDSSKKDTMNIVDGSTGEKRQIISFATKNCREDTAFYNADRHYYSHIQVYSIINGKRKPIGEKQYGYYVPHGCFEDVPENWVLIAKEYVVPKK